MDLNLDIFKISHNNIKPAKGRILIAEPFLQGYYFQRSIILLTEHDENGSMGLVLNKPLDVHIKEVFHSLDDSEELLYCGGPVSPDKVFYIHTLGHKIPGSVKIKDSLYFGGSFQFLKDLLYRHEVDPASVRFFIGYSGWSPGQLTDEIKDNSWLVSDISADAIMSRPNNKLWQETMQKLGTRYRTWSEFPKDPTLN